VPRTRRRRPRTASTAHDTPSPPPNPSPSLTLARRRVSPAREWRWRTFPVFFTFAATLFLTALVGQIVEATGRLSVGVLVLPGAIALAIALAHLVSVLFAGARVPPPEN
jgi:hypothetical protein